MLNVRTVNRHILDRQGNHPGATGALSALLTQMALAGKIVSRHVNKAGLVDILGAAGHENVQGEVVQKLDVLANDVMVRMFDHTGYIFGMASEEVDDIIHIPEYHPRGKYLLVFDPLDGSSNIDVNVSIGTIFGIYRRVSEGSRPTLEDFLQPGRQLVAAGYVLYGSSTMLVYSAGEGVHAFTLDPEYGEFLLAQADLEMPDVCSSYSVNEANYGGWSAGSRSFVDHVKGRREPRYDKTGARYIGSLVADFHRTLLKGGVFLYPEDTKNPAGKLRLLYEAAPLAFIAEQAGGRASNGRTPILDLVPDGLHQRTPLVIGSATDVQRYEAHYAAS